MFFFRHGAIALGFLLLLLSGCGDSSMHETWKGTKKLYYEYLNPPASIDYDDSGDLDDSEALLGRNMQIVDAKLTRFERYMMNQDRPPSQESVNELFDRFRWVSGVAAISVDGEILAQQPENIKQINFASLLEVEPITPRGLRAAVQTTPFGPEILLAAPVYQGTELQGLFIAHFDIRLLLDGVPNPGNLVITSSQGVLWPGVFGGIPLDGEGWAEVVRKDSSGVLSGGHGKFYWMSRYLGNLPIIFGSPAKENVYPVDASQLEVLRELGITVPEPTPVVDASAETVDSEEPPIVEDSSEATQSLVESDEDNFEIIEEN